MGLPNNIQYSNRDVPFQDCIWEGKHLPAELEYKSLWASRWLNMNHAKSEEKRLLQLNQLDEWRKMAYDNMKLCKERAKKWHDMHIRPTSFTFREKVLLYNSRLRLFPSKL